MNNRALKEVEDLIQIKNRLLELCMYALIRDTKIYNHELDIVGILCMFEVIGNIYDKGE